MNCLNNKPLFTQVLLISAHSQTICRVSAGGSCSPPHAVGLAALSRHETFKRLFLWAPEDCMLCLSMRKQNRILQGNVLVSFLQDRRWSYAIRMNSLLLLATQHSLMFKFILCKSCSETMSLLSLRFFLLVTRKLYNLILIHILCSDKLKFHWGLGWSYRETIFRSVFENWRWDFEEHF